MKIKDIKPAIRYIRVVVYQIFFMLLQIFRLFDDLFKIVTRYKKIFIQFAFNFPSIVEISTNHVACKTSF